VNSGERAHRRRRCYGSCRPGSGQEAPAGDAATGAAPATGDAGAAGAAGAESGRGADGDSGDGAVSRGRWLRRYIRSPTRLELTCDERRSWSTSPAST